MKYCRQAHITFKVDRRHDWEQDEGNMNGYQQGFPNGGGGISYNSMLDYNRGVTKNVDEVVGSTKVEKKENRWIVF